MSHPEDLGTTEDLKREIVDLRAGEEGGWVEGVIPTPGQYLKRLHEYDEERRMQSLATLFEAAEIGRRCAMELHDANLSELRQRVMSSWQTLAAISSLCRDPNRDGLLHVSEITELLPEALRYG